MKGTTFALLFVFFLTTPVFAQTDPDAPEYFREATDTGDNILTVKCRDVCLETDEHGTCIKVEVQCD